MGKLDLNMNSRSLINWHLPALLAKAREKALKQYGPEARITPPLTVTNWIDSATIEQLDDEWLVVLYFNVGQYTLAVTTKGV
jgi:hypothetical protein